ncbi:serine/threonine-protein kinase [Pseudohalioglobus lutimaris]|uniref:Serine/threonine protein kinase n=1 Tax=Pseudohalioglobus lutimaris TaxID=1737061 RepID=A0A2N5X2C8_9GAMM|nr:serine/threonine-protein kinase [Pseudohalioglobus lutimaris]PLW68639.1 serine/threonine protein kinase [Pseudohalioglobus lutimaris]
MKIPPRSAHQAEDLTEGTVADTVVDPTPTSGPDTGEQATVADTLATPPVSPGDDVVDPVPGDIISGRYRLEHLLGEGGMGRVFLAVDQLYEREFKDRQSKVAIKFLGSRFASHGVARMALQRETRKSQQLSHPNVVHVLHFDQHLGQPYMIMEHIRGEPLDELIAGRARDGLPWDEAWPIIEGMAAGLSYIHGTDLVHSDFKPNNVFLTTDGAAKILDLGIARANESAQQGGQQTEFDASALGALTPAYASCEMFEGLPPGPEDDVYALACVSYELLTGKHPFANIESIKARAQGLKPARVAGLSGGRWAALEKGLAFNRADRLASVDAFAEGLSGERARRKMVLGGLAGVALAATLAAAGLGLLAMKAPDSEQVFLDSLVTAGSEPLTPEQELRVQRWLSQGDAYLEIAQAEFAAGDFASAHHILRVGADNAYSAYAGVLGLVDSPQAREGILAIIDTYAGWADTLASQGDEGGAAFATCEGLKIYPGHDDLSSLAQEMSLDC